MLIVTGGAGFIGSALLAALNAAGREDILVVDELGTTEKWKNLANKRYLDYIHKDEFKEHLLQDTDLGKVEAVIHFGACSATTELDADYMLANNYDYSRLVAEWALHHKARFIYASSAATYGDGSHGFDDDESKIASLLPLNIYGYSKQLFDQWMLRSGLADKAAGLKFFNVFGPNEYHKGDMRSVVLKAFEQVQQEGKIRLFKSHRADYRDGEQKRDFVYVKDCCDVTMWLLEHPEVNGIFNLGTGKARTWNDLARAVFAALGKETRIEYADMPPVIRDHYQYFTQASMEKLSRAGCPVQFRSLEESVSDYITGYLLKTSRYL